MNMRRYTELLLCCIACCFNPLATASDDFYIVVSKGDRQLAIKQGENTVKTFHAATGKAGNSTKIEQGDSKTPVGTYRIVDLKTSGRFHFFMQIDYPGQIDAWQGYINRIISADEFKQIASAHKERKIPPQDTRLGGYIGIHGLGETNKEKLLIHRQADWTEGCVALTNADIMELKKYVRVGTQVVIRE